MMFLKNISYNTYPSISVLQDRLSYLANPSQGTIPDTINAFLVFGSNRVETINKVISFIKDHSQFRDVPIIISGKGKSAEIEGITEAESYYNELLFAGITNPVYLDKEAENTEENVLNMLEILDSEGIARENLVSFNFAILNRSSRTALQKHGIHDLYSISSDITRAPGKSYTETIFELRDWINFHYEKQKRLIQQLLKQSA